jgi:YHS domain-containing protein
VSSRQAFFLFVGAIAFAVIVGAHAKPALAQSPNAAAKPPQHAAAAPDQEHDGPDMQMARDGSGTGWLPDATPMYAVHTRRGAWQLMLHENLFIQFLHESGDRGHDQFGSINWLMGMADRRAGPGTLRLSGMLSAEPATIRGCGYPDLLASGERCQGEQIHDQQHPHDLVMELSAEYNAPLTGSIRWQVYGGPAGEPALGPVAYPHRLSAMPNPLAPISHHWLDATHITFGVVTAGVYGDRWKTEGSVFNGREPDENRTTLEFAPLDSVSGRVWFLPTPNWAVQVSAGRLTEAEPSESGGSGIDVTRATASATYHSAFRANSIWATTVAWGRNSEPGHASNAFLLESNLTFDDRNTWFGRFEIVGKSAHDLATAESADSFTVAKVQGGYTRYLKAWNGLQPGVGGSLSAGLVPERLEAVYGSRVNAGFGVFVTLRPVAMMMRGGNAAGGTQALRGRTMVMVQTALDPAKLSCSSRIDPQAASTATYQGKTFYFCSVKERDEFLTDPAMSLSMMPPKK